MTKAKATKITKEAPAKEAAAASASGPVTRDPAPGFDKNELPAETGSASPAVATDADVRTQVEPAKDKPADAPEIVERETRAVRKRGGSDIEPDAGHRFPGRD